MKIGDYVKQYRMEHGLSMQAFGERCGLSRAYISILEKGINPTTGRAFAPAVETLIKIADATNTSLNKLLQMIDGTEVVTVNSSFTPQSTIPAYPNIYSIKKKKLPILGSIACGKPIMAEEYFEGYVYADAKFHADFCLRAQGDSMINARIYDGDIVFIRQQPVVENGEIAAVAIDNEVTLKRVYVGDNFIELRAENPRFRPMIYRKEDFDSFRIIGKAVAFQGDVV